MSSRRLDVSYYHLLCAKMTREFCYLSSTIGLTSFCTVRVYTKLKLMVAMGRPTSLLLSGHSGTFTKRESHQSNFGLDESFFINSLKKITRVTACRQFPREIRHLSRLVNLVCTSQNLSQADVDRLRPN